MIDEKQLELDIEVALLNYGYSKQVVNIIEALRYYQKLSDDGFPGIPIEIPIDDSEPE